MDPAEFASSGTTTRRAAIGSCPNICAADKNPVVIIFQFSSSNTRALPLEIVEFFRRGSVPVDYLRLFLQFFSERQFVRNGKRSGKHYSGEHRATGYKVRSHSC